MEEEDKMAEKQLLADEKQRAEHIMLVDLGRKNVGKVITIFLVFSGRPAPRPRAAPVRNPPQPGICMMNPCCLSCLN